MWSRLGLPEPSNIVGSGSGEGSESSSVRAVRLGRYVVLRELGRGGMARVFEGRHAELGHQVALKVMNPTLAEQPSTAARFLREARVASQIRHDNVVRVFDIGVEDGLPFIVMEFLDGVDLATLLARHGALPLNGVADILLPAISAVAAAHDAGVVHRDLKPANLMLAHCRPRGPRPVILDFGISKFPAGNDLEPALTHSEALLGTIQYMAPELSKGAGHASPASDQYALGVMLYECATGRRPFTGSSYYDLMHAILTQPVVPPGELCPDLPREFDALVLRAMHRDPAKRYSSVQALGNALLSFGSKRAWTLWEDEFLGDERPIDALWERPANTMVDGTASAIAAPPRYSAAPSDQAVSPRPRRWWLAATVTGGLVALASGWLTHTAAQAPVLEGAAPALAVTAPAAKAPFVTAVSLVADATPSVSNYGLEVGSSSPVSVSVAQGELARTSVSSAPKAPVPQRRHAVPEQHVAPAPTANKNVEWGPNGALILD